MIGLPEDVAVYTPPFYYEMIDMPGDMAVYTPPFLFKSLDKQVQQQPSTSLSNPL